MHIIGTTGEGKSKFLEYMIREDIDRGNGLCFLDPSDRGDTLYKVLKYCAKVGRDKVLLIDPHHKHTYKVVCPINPFSKYKEASVANIMDTIRVLFGTADAAETPRIQRYLPAILSVLWNAKMTLHEALYFTDPLYAVQREKILSASSELDRHRLELERVFSNATYFRLNFESTINRLQPLFQSTLDLMFGYRDGVKFTDLIAEGWVILVNLYAGFGFEPIHTRLLGTTIINEIIFALDRLANRGWKGVYYLYIDEAGRYANRNLANLLAYKRKSGLRLTVAHQYFKQFEDDYVLDAIMNLCKLKVAFNIPSREDRDKIVRNFYGGELKDSDVSYELSNLRKQNAVIKVPKKAPMIVRVPDVPDVDINLGPYIQEIYKNPWYKTPNEIIHDQEQRLYELKESHERQTAADPRPPDERKNVKRKAANDSHKRDKRNTKTVFDE